MDAKELELIYRLRRVLSDMNVVEAIELLRGRLEKVKTNAEFLMTIEDGHGPRQRFAELLVQIEYGHGS